MWRKVAALVLGLGVLAGCSSAKLSVPKPAATMGPMPTCEGTPVADQIGPESGPGIGTWPLWLAGFEAGKPAVLNVAGAPRTDHGWAHKTLLVPDLHFAGTYTLQGREVKDGTPLLFEYGLQPPAPQLTLDRFSAGPGYIWVLKAGCYRIEVQWKGGSWSVTVPAGA